MDSPEVSVQPKLPTLPRRIVQACQKLYWFIIDWIRKFKIAQRKEQLKMIKKPLFAFLALILILEFGNSLLPPKIVSISPENQGAEIPLDSKIEITFSKGVIKSLAQKSFVLAPSTQGEISWEGDKKLIFTPKEKFNRASSYQISFRGVVFSKFLMPLIGTKTASFTTLGNPRIALFSPQVEALEDLTPITIIFDRPMVPLTVSKETSTLMPAFTIEPEIKGNGRWLGTTAYQFRPSEKFRKATMYKVTVPAGIKSQDGGKLQHDFSWEFSSERPRVISTTPERDYAYASPAGPISVTFNQNIDLSSVKEKFVLYDVNKNKIPGSITTIKNVAKFYPSQALKRGEVYTATIFGGVLGVEGTNGMESDYSWTFAVAEWPGVISTTPANKSKDISEQYQIEVLFRTPMNEKSFENNVSISPKPDNPPSLYFSNYNSRNSLSIDTYLGRSTTYTVTIGSKVEDQYGVPLGKPYVFEFTTASYNPSVSIFPFGTYFGSFNQEVTPRIVAQVTNANKVNYSLYKLKREDFLDLYRKRYGQQCGEDEKCRNWQSYDTSKLEKIRSWSEDYEAEFNIPTRVATKITTPSGGKIPSGFYFLELSIPQGVKDNMVMIVSKSTLAVKKSNSQIFSWAVNQSTGNVVSGMKMQLTDSLGKVLAEGSSNDDGVFMKNADLINQYELFVFGQKDDDLVVASSIWSQGIDRYDFGLPSYYNENEYKDYYSKQGYKIFVTLDRPIFRPGQKVYFKGVIKKDNDGEYENIKPGEKISVNIRDSLDRSIYTQDLPITTFGSFSGDFVLSKDANLGYYQIKSTFDGNSNSHEFQVEEYKKPDLAITVNPSKANYVQGEKASAKINASYYFGAPVANTPISWVLQTQDYSFRWDKDWRFEFGDPDSYWSKPWWYYSGSSYFSGEEVTEGSGETNANGEFEFSLPIDISQKETSQRMMVEATVNDASNQSVASSQEFIVHKGGLYVGLRPVSYLSQSGKETKVEVVTVDLKGAEVPNTQVSLEFYKRTWKTVKEKNPDDDQFYYVSKANDSLVETTEVTTDSLGRAIATFTPHEGGTFKVAGKVVDKKGNSNTSSAFVWVSGPGFSAERENNDRIVLVTDKQEYQTGETISTFVASPFASETAKTLLTAERGSVLDYKIVDTSETSNNFAMKVLPKYSPNVFVGAVLVRKGNEVKKPAEFKIGYAEVKVSDKRQQLNVKITTDKKEYKPKDTLIADIETKDLLGNPVPTELAIGLVDKAAWDLSSVELPDIFKTFYRPRDLGVATSHLLTISLDRIYANTNLGSKGGSGGCFTGDTPILMKGGVTKNIQDIQVGDMVLTRENEKSAKWVEGKVTKTYEHRVDEYLVINGNLKVTPIHRILVNGKWITAGEIEKGDYLLDKNNELIEVFSIERVWGDFTVYNLEIEKYRTYFANGIYVHNQKGGGADTSRTNFPDTAYWNPSLKTNNLGKARVKIQLPDNLTTWKLNVTANSQKAEFGSKTTEITTSRDILIRPFLPRFLVVGDTANLGGIIVNTSNEDQKLSVKIEASKLQIVGNPVKEVNLEKGAQEKVTWEATAKEANPTNFRIAVESNKGTQDSVEIILPIKPSGIPETVATSGQVKNVISESILLPKDTDPKQGTVSVSLSPSLGADSVNALPFLLSYPYFCTEQITSKFSSAVFINRILMNSKMDTLGPAKKADLDETVKDAIQRLSNQQHSDGGWGWWTEYESNGYLTAYAYSSLYEAKKDGFTVPAQTLEKAENYLRSQLAGNKQDLSLDTRAYIVYVLRETKPSLSSYMANLFERRFELSLESRTYLAMAMKDAPGMESRAKKLSEELIGLVKKTATSAHWEEQKRDYYFIGSNITTTAVMLEMLNMFDNENPLIPEVVRYLMSTRTDNHWPTTKDTSAVIKAISAQLLDKKDQKVNKSYRLELNGKLFGENNFTEKNLLEIQDYIFSTSKLNIGKENSLKVSEKGEGNLYYNINLKYYSLSSEIKPLEQGMVVVREFVDGKGNVLPTKSIYENSELWVRLIIATPEDRYFVIIEDALPAGLESVNESLKNVSVLNKVQPKLKEKGDQPLYFDHKEYHDDKTSLFANYLPAGVYEVSYRVRATTPGKYHYLPAQAYQMYLPDVSGHSEGGWLEIKPRL